MLATEHCRLGLIHMSRFFDDRRNLRVDKEILETLLVLVEDYPDPIRFHRIAIDRRAFGTVALSLLGAFGREDLQEVVEILDFGRCEHHAWRA